MSLTIESDFVLVVLEVLRAVHVHMIEISHIEVTPFVRGAINLEASTNRLTWNSYIFKGLPEWGYS